MRAVKLDYLEFNDSGSQKHEIHPNGFGRDNDYKRWKEAILPWCIEQFGHPKFAGRWWTGGYIWSFQRREDAMLFKLKWDGTEID